MKKTTEQQVVALFVQALRTALALIDETPPAATTTKSKTKLANGIYPHQSKYNPFRAYVWDKAAHRTIYLGAFPSVNQAKLAQRAYRKGQAITSGTRAVLRIVKAA